MDLQENSLDIWIIMAKGIDRRKILPIPNLVAELKIFHGNSIRSFIVIISLLLLLLLLDFNLNRGPIRKASNTKDGAQIQVWPFVIFILILAIGFLGRCFGGIFLEVPVGNSGSLDMPKEEEREK